MKSASSGQRIPVTLKAKEATRQFWYLMRERAPWRSRDFSHLHEQYCEYEEILKAYGGLDLKTCRTFEIGSGQRPYRLLYLLASGIDAYGIDLDTVVDRLTLATVKQMYAANGFERTAKTVGRYALFDRAENSQLARFLSERQGGPFEWPSDRIVHGSASDPAAWPDGAFDFVFSEDVFEHISADHLEKVCAVLGTRLSPGGVAFIRPMVFTGIQGGHNVEWYDVSPGRERQCPAWDHLRGYRFPANTYLNMLTLSDYRALFKRHLRIVDEIVKHPNLGREHLTPEVRAELAAYPDEELLSNQVGFVLARKE